MTKLALLTRPVEKVEGKLPLLINLHGGGPRWFNMSFQQQLAIARQMGMKRGFDLAELAGQETDCASIPTRRNSIGMRIGWIRCSIMF